MKHVAVALVMAWSSLAAAEAVYPKSVPLRLFGMNQLWVGSCRAESEVAALEHAFAARGLPILLSTYHRHALNWKSNPKPSEREQFYEGEDTNILSQTGDFVPNYIWPEDSTGLRPNDNWRPSFGLHSAYIKGFPRLAISASRELFARPKGGGTWYGFGITSFDRIKNLVRQGQPVTTSLHADFLKLMDEGTGLLREPYRSDWFNGSAKEYAEGDNHSVAVVGFDDDLYDGQGAFIVRNSWNDWDEVRLAKVAQDNPARRAELEKFRLRISSNNLPGYYALPYQYLRDKFAAPNLDPNAANGVGVSTVFEVDYGKTYDVYQSRWQDYPIYNVPFMCDRAVFDGEVNRFEMLRDRTSDPMMAERLVGMLMSHATNRERSSFQIARLTVALGQGPNRVEDLAAGKLWDYYCTAFDKGLPRFPNADDFNDPKFKEILESLRVGETSLKPWYQLFQWASCKRKGEFCL